MKEEMAWRQLLWLHHGCWGPCLYGDDGEMQCNNTQAHKPIDFKRDSIDEIRVKFMLEPEKWMEVMKEVFGKKGQTPNGHRKCYATALERALQAEARVNKLEAELDQEITYKDALDMAEVRVKELEAECQCYEAMKEGVQERVSNLEASLQTEKEKKQRLVEAIKEYHRALYNREVDCYIAEQILYRVIDELEDGK